MNLCYWHFTYCALIYCHHIFCWNTELPETLRSFNTSLPSTHPNMSVRCTITTIRYSNCTTTPAAMEWYGSHTRKTLRQRGVMPARLPPEKSPSHPLLRHRSRGIIYWNPDTTTPIPSERADSCPDGHCRQTETVQQMTVQVKYTDLKEKTAFFVNTKRLQNPSP